MHKEITAVTGENDVGEKMEDAGVLQVLKARR